MIPHPNLKKYCNYQNSSKSREETERNCLINKAKSQDCNGLFKKNRGESAHWGKKRKKSSFLLKPKWLSLWRNNKLLCTKYKRKGSLTYYFVITDQKNHTWSRSNLLSSIENSSTRDKFRLKLHHKKKAFMKNTHKVIWADGVNVSWLWARWIEDE